MSHDAGHATAITRRRARLFGAVACGAVWLMASWPAAQAQTLESLLARAGERVLAYNRQFQPVVAEESYIQILRYYAIGAQVPTGRGLPGSEVVDSASGHKLRKMRANFALVASPDGDRWFTFRDVFEVDGKTIPDRKDRMGRTLQGSPQTARVELDQMSAESKRYNLGSIARNVNVPTLALTALMPANQKGMAFQRKGEKKVDDVRAWIVAFTETQRPTIVTTAENKPMPCRGELWIDPTTAQVLKTRIVWDTLDAFPDMKEHPERYTAFPRIEIEVTYKREPKLDMWVPVEMKELYDRQVEVVSSTATYSNFRRLETEAGVLIPK